MKKYLIVVEKTRTGFSAYSPDLDGCVATGSTRKQVERAMREAIEFHLEGLRSQGYRVPAPHSYATWVETAHSGDRDHLFRRIVIGHSGRS